MSGTELERMLIRLVGDGSSYMKMLEDAKKESRATASVMDSLQGTAQNVLGTMASLGASASLAGLAKQAVSLAAEAEQMKISFSTMLQSGAKGTQMVKDLQRFAAETPMTLPGLQRAAKTLLQFGATGNEIMPTLKMLGDVTGGNEAQFQSMALAFGQMMGTGRLMGGELLQMVNAGFNPLEEMSRTTGKGMGQLKKEMEEGRITVDLVSKAFMSATSAGGRFNDLMKKQSQSLTGLLSTLSDDFGGLLRSIGETSVETLRLKDAVAGLSQMAQSLETSWNLFPDALKHTLQYVGSVTAGLLALTTVLGVGRLALSGMLAVIGPVVTGIMSYVTWANLAAAATVAWQGALAAGLIYGFTRVLGYLYQTTTAMKAFNEETKKSVELGDRLAGIQAGKNAQVIEGLAKDPKERMIQLNDLINTGDRNIAGKQSGVNMAQAEVKGANKDLWDSAQDAIWGNPNADLARKNLAAAEKDLADYRKFVDQLKAERQKLDKSRADKKLNEEVQQIVEGLGKEAMAAGKTADEVVRMDLAKKGASAAQLESIKRSQEYAEYVKKEADAMKGLQDANRDLTAELAKRGLKARGLSDKAAGLLGSGMNLTPAMREELKQNVKMADELRAMELKDEYRTGKDKALERQAELNRLYRDGVLDALTYSRGLQEVAKEMYGVSAATRDAVLVGSGEDAARVFAYGRQQEQPAALARQMGTGSGEDKEQTVLLRDIRGELREARKAKPGGTTVTLAPAGIK